MSTPESRKVKRERTKRQHLRKEKMARKVTGDIITAASWNQDMRNTFIAYKTQAQRTNDVG